jgi:hypothetical protein
LPRCSGIKGPKIFFDDEQSQNPIEPFFLGKKPTPSIIDYLLTKKKEKRKDHTTFWTANTKEFFYQSSRVYMYGIYKV